MASAVRVRCGKCGALGPKVTEKRCPQCKQTLPLIAFAVDPRRKLGRASYCLACARAYHQRRRDLAAQRGSLGAMP